MNKKIDNLKELEYYTNYNTVSDVILKLRKKYPESEKVKDAVDAMTQIGFYVQNLISDTYYFNKSLEMYRSDKLRAIERARKAEKKLQQYE